MAIEQHYDAKDLMRLFKISKSEAYNWLKQMKTFEKGNLRRVEETELRRFILQHQSKGMNLDVITRTA
jgi:hypothetical protein